MCSWKWDNRPPTSPLSSRKASTKSRRTKVLTDSTRVSCLCGSDKCPTPWWSSLPSKALWKPSTSTCSLPPRKATPSPLSSQLPSCLATGLVSSALSCPTPLTPWSPFSTRRPALARLVIRWRRSIRKSDSRDYGMVSAQESSWLVLSLDSSGGYTTHSR